MTRLIISALLSAFLFCALHIKAQSKDQLYYNLETGITQAGGKHAPLWLTANKYGLSSITKNNGYVLAGIIQPLKGNERFSYGYGLELATAWGFTSSFIVQQAYLDLKWNRFTLSIGSKERAPEFANPELSSGALTLSGNARPIPQVCIGIDDYYTVPRTNNWLAIRGHFAYGRFTDDNWQKSFANATAKRTRDVLYHSKAFYFRIGNTQKFPLTFEAGLQMETEFGGKQYLNGQVTKFPSKLKDYFEVIIPSAGGSDSPIGDQENIEGNITGSWHAAITYYANNWKLRGYYEHYFEDHSMLSVDYPWIDGLYAVELTLPKNPFVSQILYEYMCSRDQTSPTPDKSPASVCDNYYNHWMYTGWQHWGMGLGNPLLISPIYNTNGEIYFYDNRVIANHFGIKGNPTSEISYRLMFSLSRNWGTYSQPFKKEVWQNYTLAEICYTPTKLPGWQFTASYGTDHGKITGNNHGCMITIRKTGLIK